MVVDDVERAVASDLVEGPRGVPGVVGRAPYLARHLRGEERVQLGRGVRVAGRVEVHLVPAGDEAVAQVLDDPLGAAVAGGRHRDPRRRDLGDPHDPIVSDGPSTGPATPMGCGRQPFCR